MRNNCSKEFNMKKTGIVIAAIALVAAAGIFAQPSPKAKNADAKNAPNFKEPPKFEKPSDADLKAYHDAELQSYKILLDAQVKAKMVTQEWADAKMAILKAVQKDCKGFCIIRKSTDIPFGVPVFGGPGFGKHHFGPRHHCGPHKRHGNFKGRPHPRFDPNFSFNEAQPDEAEEALEN